MNKDVASLYQCIAVGRDRSITGFRILSRFKLDNLWPLDYRVQSSIASLLAPNAFVGDSEPVARLLHTNKRNDNAGFGYFFGDYIGLSFRLLVCNSLATGSESGIK